MLNDYTSSRAVGVSLLLTALVALVACGPTYDPNADGNNRDFAAPTPTASTRAGAATPRPSPGRVKTSPATVPTESAAAMNPRSPATESAVPRCVAANFGTPQIINAVVLDAEPSAPGRGSGQLAFDVQLTNTSASSCRLSGYPGLTLRGDWAAGKPESTPSNEVRRIPGQSVEIVLATGGATVFGVVSGSTICLTEPSQIEVTVSDSDDPIVLKHPSARDDRTWFCYDEGNDVAPFGTPAPGAAISR